MINIGSINISILKLHKWLLFLFNLLTKENSKRLNSHHEKNKNDFCGKHSTAKW